MANELSVGLAGFEEIQNYVREKLKLIPMESQNLKDPYNRATEFLLVIANLNDFKQKCESDLARIQTIVDGTYHNAKENSSGKNITEKKLDANIDKNYTDTRETLADVESMIKWTKTSVDIFNNAHLTYRQRAKD
jgi:hypothetical protein